MRSRFIVAAPLVALGVVVACGGSDTKRKAPADDGGADAGAGGRAPGSGGAPASGGAQAGGAPQSGGAPGAGGAQEAGAPDAEAGLPDAPDAPASDAPPDAPPPPPFQCVDGGDDVVNVFSCQSLSVEDAFFDPVAKTVTVEMPAGYRFDGVDLATDAVDVAPATHIRFDYETDAGIARGDVEGRTPQIVGNRAVYSVPEIPDRVTVVRLALHRVRDAEGRLLVGEVDVTFDPPSQPPDGGLLWPASGCDDDRAFGPPIVYRCSDVGAVTYDPATGELTLDARFPGSGSYGSADITRYVNGLPQTSTTNGRPIVTGTRNVWQLGADPSVVAVTFRLYEAYGYCDATYYGETVHRLVAPGGVDGGLPPPPADGGAAADAAVGQFWESSCEYEKFFWRWRD